MMGSVAHPTFPLHRHPRSIHFLETTATWRLGLPGRGRRPGPRRLLARGARRGGRGPRPRRGALRRRPLATPPLVDRVGLISGLEAKELWPAFREMTRPPAGLRGGPAGGRRIQRRAREGGLHPHVRDAPVLHRPVDPRGVDNQASVQTHFVYFLASELGETSRTRSGAATIRSSTRTPRFATCGCSDGSRPRRREPEAH